MKNKKRFEKGIIGLNVLKTEIDRLIEMFCEDSNHLIKTDDNRDRSKFMNEYRDIVVLKLKSSKSSIDNILTQYNYTEEEQKIIKLLDVS